MQSNSLHFDGCVTRCDAADDAGPDADGFVFRRDTSELASPEEVPGGFLRVQGFATRAGVFAYRDPVTGAVTREFRPPEVVFRADTLRSLELVPLTLEHPDKDDLLTPENVGHYVVGTAGRPERVGNRARVDILIQRADAIQAAREGKVQLSYGYRAKVEKEDGVWTDDDGRTYRYDAIQRRIVGNHLALTSRARGGAELSIRMDSATGMPVDAEPKQEAPKKMALRKIKGVEVNIPDEIVAHFDSLESEAKAARSEVDTTKGELAAAKSQLATAQADSTKRDAADKTDAARAAERAAMDERIRIVAQGAKILGKPVDDVMRMDSADIMRAVISKESPEVKLDSESSDFVRGVYRQLVADRVDTAEEIKRMGDRAREHVTTERTRKDAEDANDPDKERQAMIARDANRWRTHQPAAGKGNAA